MGVIDLTPGELLAGNFEQLEIFLISRLPRLLAILCTGIGMSVAGLIMQQLCSNKFVSPTTGATHLLGPVRHPAGSAVYCRPPHCWKPGHFCLCYGDSGHLDLRLVHSAHPVQGCGDGPSVVGIMFGNVIGGITNYLAYKYEMTQALSSWLVGHFSLVLKGPV